MGSSVDISLSYGQPSKNLKQSAMNFKFLKLLIIGVIFSSCEDETTNSKVTISQADLVQKKWKQIEDYSPMEDNYLPHDTFEFFNNGLYRASVVRNFNHQWNTEPARTFLIGKISFDDVSQSIGWIDVDTATKIPYSRHAWVFKEKTDSVLIFETTVDINFPEKNKQIYLKMLK